MTSVLELNAPLQSSPATVSEVVRAFLAAWSPRILVASLGAVLASRVAMGGFGWSDVAVLVALVAAWPIVEWMIHVFILHFRPKKFGKLTIDLPVAIKHRAHHRDPWRLDLVFVPLHVYLYAVPLYMGLWWWSYGNSQVVLTGLVGWLALSLHYEWVHFLVHTRYKPRSAYYQRLWRNHRLHHCKNERYWMGVSRLEGDYVLGTHPQVDAVPTSDTCRTLGIETTLGA